MSNFIQLTQVEGREIHQYHVDFRPDIPNTSVKKGLLYHHSEQLGRIRVFDGMQLFLPKLLGEKNVIKFKVCY